jgi:cytochrome c5
MRLLVGIILVIAAILGLTISYFLHRPTPTIISTPLPNVETSRVAHYPLTFVMQLKNDPQAGKKIFAEYCSACHSPNAEIPLHAPRIGYKKDWQKFKNMRFEDLFKLAMVGYGAMPARGGCFECTDEQLKQAIKYMLSKNK